MRMGLVGQSARYARARNGSDSSSNQQRESPLATRPASSASSRPLYIGGVTPTACAALAIRCHVPFGMGMPEASRSARIASPRSPGSMIFFTPSARARPAMAVPSRSASRRKRSRSPNAAEVDRDHRAVEERIVADRPAFQVRRDARLREQEAGQALDHERQARALDAPPSAARSRPPSDRWCRGRPCRRPSRSGIVSPRSAAPMILPLATTPVEKSSRYGRPFLRGTANAIGLDDTAATRVPG